MAEVVSPLPGTFYWKPSPEASPYKSAGDPVSPEDTIGLIEVMKTFIEVKAETAGSFASYSVDDGLPVQAGQVLAQLET